MIERVELENFRNFVSRSFETGSGDVVLTGPNGSGKTNLLEAIYFLSILRSFRGAAVREMRRIGSRGFGVGARLCRNGGSEHLKVLEGDGGGRELWIGSSRLRKASDFIREFRAVAFVPEDREIPSGSSGFRRRFFDMLISAAEPEYLAWLSAYSKALLQRNRALKFGRPKLAAAFEPELADRAPRIGRLRKKYAEQVADEVNRMLGGKAAFAISHQCDYPDDAEKILESFEKSREKEMRRGCTSTGPQLDEFEFRLDEKVMRYYASTGQLRIVSILLKLAEFNILRNDRNIPVLTLADDVTGELDEENRALFFGTISAADQRFFTFTAFPGDEYFGNKLELPIGSGPSEGDKKR